MNNRGSILIVVLIFTAVLAAGAVTLLNEVSNDLDWTQRLYQNNQASFYVHSALKYVKKIINDDNNGYDSDDDAWADLPSVPIKGGFISVQVMPANAKIDINEILSDDKAVEKRTVNALKQILSENDTDENAVGYIREWIDKKQKYDENYYQDRLPPYHPDKEPFYSLKEIDYVEGLDRFAEKFGSYFTVDGSQSININFAGKSTLEAYLPEVANAAGNIIKYRKKHPFENITQLRNVQGINDNQYLTIQPYITTTSDNFIIKIIVKFGKKEYNVTALIKRESGQTKLVKYFEGKSSYE